MPRLIPPLAVLAAVLVRAVSVHAQQAPVPLHAPPPLSLLDVRLACVNPSTTAQMDSLCHLPLSRDSLRVPAVWQRWAAAAEVPRLDSLIRAQSDYDPNQLKLADVIGNLEEAAQARVLNRIFKDSVNFRRVLSNLPQGDLAQLYHSATDSTLPDDADAEELAQRLRTLIGAFTADPNSSAPRLDTLNDSTVAFKMRQQIVTRLTSSELVRLLSRVPTVRRGVLKSMTKDATVARILFENPDEEIRRRLTVAAAEEFAPTTAARERTSINRQSDLLWGATDFVVDRVQQQLQVYAVQGFTSRLCRDVGATVLHESCAMLRSERFGLTQPGVTLLRSAVRQDLQSLPASMLEWTYSQHIGDLTDGQADQLFTALQVTRFALDAARGDDPWLALAEVADHFRGIRDTLAVRRLLPRLRADSTAAETAASAAHTAFAALVPTDSLYFRARARLDTAKVRLDTASSRLNRTLNRLALGNGTPVTRLLLSISELASTRFDALRLRNLVPEDLNSEELLRYQLIALMANQQERRAIDGGLVFEPEKLVPLALAVNDQIQRLKLLRSQIDSVAEVRRDTTRSVTTIRRELAQDAFSTVETLLSQTVQLRAFRDGNEYARLVAAQQTVVATREVVIPVLNGEYGTGLLALRRQVAPFFVGDSATAVAWTRGMVFVSDLVNANNSEQVTAALRRFADTGGGFLAKRNSRALRISLNAYGGVFGGRETADQQGARFGGVYLPVGFSAVLPVTFKPYGGRRLGRFGLFVQAVDLGALASWRLSSSSSDNEKIDERPQVGVAQVISPGIFATFDLHALPITFGFGGARSPQLREKTQFGTTSEGEQTTTRTTVDAVRRGFFIAFDIPLFP